MECQQPKEKFTRLLHAYQATLADISNEPAVSFRPYLVYVGKCLVWIVYLYALIITVPVNLLIWIINQVRSNKLRYLKNYFVIYSVQGFKGLIKGNITYLGLINVKYITHFFACLHIKSNTKRIIDYLNGIEIENHLQGKAEDKELGNFRDLLTKYNSNVDRNMQFKIFVIALSYITISLEWIEKHTGIEFPPVFQFFVNDLAIAMVVAMILAVTMSSSHIRKRVLFEKNDVYKIESEIFRESKIPLVYEFPFDIIGWVIYFILGILPAVFQSIDLKELRPEDGTYDIVVAGIIAFSLVYLARLRNMSSAGEPAKKLVYPRSLQLKNINVADLLLSEKVKQVS